MTDHLTIPSVISIWARWQSVIDGSCNTGAVNCGPPIVKFWGGGGTGASGNAVVNAVGEILGVQIVTPGSGYTSPPIEFEDACGKGKVQEESLSLIRLVEEVLMEALISRMVTLTLLNRHMILLMFRELLPLIHPSQILLR